MDRSGPGWLFWYFFFYGDDIYMVLCNTTQVSDLSWAFHQFDYECEPLSCRDGQQLLGLAEAITQFYTILTP